MRMLSLTGHPTCLPIVLFWASCALWMLHAARLQHNPTYANEVDDEFFKAGQVKAVSATTVYPVTGANPLPPTALLLPSSAGLTSRCFPHSVCMRG